MKIKYIYKIVGFSFICLFFHLNGKAQNERLGLYYKSVINAEESIVKDSFLTANQLYSKAFKCKKYPFVRDIENAINCLIVDKSNIDSLKLINYLILLQKIENDSISNLINSDTHKSMLGNLTKINGFNKYISIVENQFHKRNNSIKKTLESMLDDDQKIRNIAYKKYGNNFYYSPYHQKIVTQDSINLFKIIALYKNNEITEYTAGKEGLFAIDIVALHNSAWCKNNLIPLLKSQVKKGNFNAFVFAHLADRLKDNNCPNVKQYNYGSSYGQIYGNYYIITKADSATSVKINNNRKEIYLTDSYLDAHRRTALGFRDNKIFFLGFSKNIYSLDNKEALRMLNSLKNKHIESEYYKSTTKIDINFH